MKNLKRGAKAFSLSAIALMIPTNVIAENIKICAHPEGYISRFMHAEIKVFKDGAMIEVETDRLDDNCYSMKIKSCGKTTKITAISGKVYKGEASCRTKPQPLLISMEPQKIEILTSSFSGIFDGKIQGLNSEGLLKNIITADELLSADAETKAVLAEFYAAAAAYNDADAQKLANMIAGTLRSKGQTELSLAFSSLTYVAGFRAIGIEALAPDNPLLAVAGEPTSAYLVMNKTGQDWLESYQNRHTSNIDLGVWDYPTSEVIAKTTPSISETILKNPSAFEDRTEYKAIAPPKNIDLQKLELGFDGRIKLPPT